MTEINHAHLWIMLPKEWFSEYIFYDMATRQGKYLVWSLHGWFDNCTGMQLSIFCLWLEEMDPGPERVVSIPLDAMTGDIVAPLMHCTAHM